MTRIALVVLDTLRKDLFDEYFDWLPGIRYENAWSTAHWTVPAHASMFTGQYASEAGVHARSHHLDTSKPTIVELLSEAGFDTLGFSSNMHVTPEFQFDRGFQEFIQHGRARSETAFPWKQYIEEGALPWPVAAPIALFKTLAGPYDTTLSLDNLRHGLECRYPSLLGANNTSTPNVRRCLEDRSLEKDTFVFMNLMEAHAPYLHPKEYQERRFSRADVTQEWHQMFADDDTDYEAERAAYRGAVRYLSDEYRRLYKQLKHFDYIITLSDHGEAFGRNGTVEHVYGVSPALTHVPVVISGSAVNDTDRVVNEPVSIRDVYETVADMAGINADSDGTPLLAESLGDPVRTEYHGITHQERIEMLHEMGFNAEQIQRYDTPKYGVASGSSYVYETMDGLSFTGGGDEARLESLLETEKERIPDLVFDDDSEVDDEVQDRLGQLGYV
ncbi:sulfatase-like hydrolase/transferase [Halorientalis pallida]|uniref:sulfatase-like hydrolase/transferase n=1 Tax=Halorientalis pallida TaxID=2479928 RepID=UPI003C6EAACB